MIHKYHEPGAHDFGIRDVPWALWYTAIFMVQTWIPGVICHHQWSYMDGDTKPMRVDGHWTTP